MSLHLELVHKVFAYITNGKRLLVLVHPEHPGAGIQVPAGTRPEMELPEDAVLREATEETGLADLRVVSYLGERDHSVPAWGQVHRRRFYHLVCVGAPPDRWQHFEQDPSDGTPGPIIFELYWVDLPDGLPELAPGHEVFLGKLSEGMGIR